MTMRAALLLLSGGGLLVGGCSSDGAAPLKYGDGQACDGGGGGDGGDGGAPAACGTVQPCGGDVVGGWKFVEECESIASFAASAARFSMMAEQSWCVSQTLVGIEPQASGSLVFGTDGSYSLAVTHGGFLDINFPANCLAGVSCADTTAGLQAQIDGGTFPMPNVTSISCSGSSNCVCRAAVDVYRAEAGTFTVSGSVVTFNAAGGAVNNKSYCVVGNALHILDTAMRTAGQTDVDSDLVAMKQ